MRATRAGLRPAPTEAELVALAVRKPELREEWRRVRVDRGRAKAHGELRAIRRGYPEYGAGGAPNLMRRLEAVGLAPGW
jgi:hypothetical protein